MKKAQIEVSYSEHMGSDLSVVNAARQSFAKQKTEFDPVADGNLINFLATGKRQKEWDEFLDEIVEQGAAILRSQGGGLFREDARNQRRAALKQLLIEYKREAQHWAPFGHPHVTLRLRIPIFLARQFVKHQVGACIAGDTEIYFERVNVGKDGVKKVKVRDLFAQWNKVTPQSRHGDTYGWRKVISARPLRVLNDETHDFEIGHITDIIYSGVKNTLKLTLKDGRTVTVTDDHKVFTQGGWLPVAEALDVKITSGGRVAFKKGVELACNGLVIEGAEETYKNYEWMRKTKEECGNLEGIASACGASTHTIRKWLRRHGLQFDHLQNLSGVNGKKVWNSGRGGYRIRTVWSEERRQAMRELRSGEKSNWWRGGVTPERVKITKWAASVAKDVRTRDGGRCLKCGSSRKLHSHHVLPVHSHPERAYDIDNLATLCRLCHNTLHTQGLESEFASVFFGKKIEVPPRPVGEHRGLVAHFLEVISVEVAGEQPVYDISVDHESHNFVGNGVVLHNCWSEESRRYMSSEPEFYFEPVLLARPDDVKQGAAGEVEHPEMVSSIMETNTELGATAYTHLVTKYNLAPEQAREILTLNTMTGVTWTGSLLFWSRVCNQRLDPHAQGAAQALARQIGDIIEPLFPYSWKALVK